MKLSLNEVKGLINSSKRSSALALPLLQERGLVYDSSSRQTRRGGKGI